MFTASLHRNLIHFNSVNVSQYVNMQCACVLTANNISDNTNANNSKTGFWWKRKQKVARIPCWTRLIQRSTSAVTMYVLKECIVVDTLIAVVMDQTFLLQSRVSLHFAWLPDNYFLLCWKLAAKSWKDRNLCKLATRVKTVDGGGLVLLSFGSLSRPCSHSRKAAE